MQATTDEKTGRLGARTVRRVGLGGMQLAEKVNAEQAVGLLRAARELGVDHLDTAAFYGADAANERIRQALHPYDEQLALVTKVGAARSGGTLIAAQRPEQLRAQVEQNLTTLGVERLAVVNLRRVDRRPGIVAEGEQLVPLEAQLAELQALRHEGKLEGIGLSNVSAEQLEASLAGGIVCVQNSHSLLDRDSDPVRDLCREHGIAWVPFCPLGSAFPNQPKVVDDPRVQAVAAETGATPAQVGLAWELAQYDGTLLIAGTTSREHLAENLAAVDVELTEDQLARLS